MSCGGGLVAPFRVVPERRFLSGIDVSMLSVDVVTTVDTKPPQTTNHYNMFEPYVIRDKQELHAPLLYLYNISCTSVDIFLRYPIQQMIRLR